MSSMSAGGDAAYRADGRPANIRWRMVMMVALCAINARNASPGRSVCP